LKPPLPLFRVAKQNVFEAAKSTLSVNGYLKQLGKMLIFDERSTMEPISLANGKISLIRY